MRFSTLVLAFSGSALALPAFSSLAARQPTDLVGRKIEFKGSEAPSVVSNLGFSRIESVAVRDEEKANTRKRSLELEPRQTTKGGSTKKGTTKTESNPRIEAIGDNKVNPTTGLTDSEAAEIVTGLDLKDKKAPGSINAKGQRNPLPGLSADDTDAIVKQGQAALKEAGA